MAGSRMDMGFQVFRKALELGIMSEEMGGYQHGGGFSVDAVVEADADADPQWDPSAQSAPEYQVDQRINW